MNQDLVIRMATGADAASVRAIYAPFVETSIISFEESVPSVEEIAARIARVLDDYAYLVAEREGEIIGFAYAGQHRTRSTYRFSVDVSVYVAKQGQRQGTGRALYGKLLPSLSDMGYHAAFAGIALPNPASIALHEAMGFEPVGIYRDVGRKFDRWHDVGWWQCRLGQDT